MVRMANTAAPAEATDILPVARSKPRVVQTTADAAPPVTAPISAYRGALLERFVGDSVDARADRPVPVEEEAGHRVGADLVGGVLVRDEPAQVTESPAFGGHGTAGLVLNASALHAGDALGEHGEDE